MADDTIDRITPPFAPQKIQDNTKKKREKRQERKPSLKKDEDGKGASDSKVGRTIDVEA